MSTQVTRRATESVQYDVDRLRSDGLVSGLESNTTYTVISSCRLSAPTWSVTIKQGIARMKAGAAQQCSLGAIRNQPTSIQIA